MKKVLLVFMVVVGFALKANANMYEVLYDLDMIYATAVEVHKVILQEEEQQRIKKMRFISKFFNSENRPQLIEKKMDVCVCVFNVRDMRRE